MKTGKDSHVHSDCLHRHFRICMSKRREKKTKSKENIQCPERKKERRRKNSCASSSPGVLFSSCVSSLFFSFFPSFLYFSRVTPACNQRLVKNFFTSSLLFPALYKTQISSKPGMMHKRYKDIINARCCLYSQSSLMEVHSY